MTHKCQMLTRVKNHKTQQNTSKNISKNRINSDDFNMMVIKICHN